MSKNLVREYTQKNNESMTSVCLSDPEFGVVPVMVENDRRKITNMLKAVKLMSPQEKHALCLLKLQQC